VGKRKGLREAFKSSTILPSWFYRRIKSSQFAAAKEFSQKRRQAGYANATGRHFRASVQWKTALKHSHRVLRVFASLRTLRSRRGKSRHRQVQGRPLWQSCAGLRDSMVASWNCDTLRHRFLLRVWIKTSLSVKGAPESLITLANRLTVQSQHFCNASIVSNRAPRCRRLASSVF
jgi:hypothetical protein